MNGTNVRPLTGAIDLRLSLPPDWPKADALAILAKHVATVAFDDADLSDTLGIVAGELMENAIKYGNWSDGDACLTFSLSWRGDELEIDVSCPSDPASAHYERLMMVLQKIEKSDTRDSYLERLARIAQDRCERGGLGLLRLAHEANCLLRARLVEERLHVQARMKIAR